MSADSAREREVEDVAHGAEGAASGDDHILVLVDRGADDLPLLAAARQLTQRLHASWTVVDVKISTLHLLPDVEGDRQKEINRRAELLGAEAVTLHGRSFARTVAAYARLRRAGKIVIGSPPRFGWRAVRQLVRIAALRRAAPDMELITIATAVRSAPVRAPRPRVRLRRPQLRDFFSSLLISALCTAFSYPLSGHVDLINIVMIYMLGAALSGLLLGRLPSVLTAIFNILAFDFFFVPPLYSLTVLDPNYLVTFAVMLIVALIIANLMIAIRTQTEAAASRERQTAALYAIARDLAIARDPGAMTQTAARHIGEVLQCYARVLFCNEDGQVLARELPPDSTARPTLEVNLQVAAWVASKRERAGLGAAQFPSERARYLPLRGSHTTIGVLVVEPVQPPDALAPEQQRLLEAIADQLALALERARMSQLAYEAQLAADRASMRNTLLASISHDLRTPLSAIAGAGSMMAQRDFALDLYRRVTLGRLIETKARDMTDLLSNVLELVRLESGHEVLNKDWHALQDLVGQAIQRQESRLVGWQLTTDLPNDLPMLLVDGHLIVQLMSNLLENALKYTPPGSRVTIAARRFETTVQISVEDNGPGFGSAAPEQFLEKFTRGRPEGNVSGVGLGLAICRIIARLHGGEIRAANAHSGGARFEISLPLAPSEPTLDIEAPAAAE